MESTIDAMIPHAIACIELKDNADFRLNGKVKGIYESYLSQFGPMCVQIGLRSTLAVYSNKENKGKGNRGYILDLIYEILKGSKQMLLSSPDVDSREKWIKKYLDQSNDINSRDEQLILDASVALKRAIRTFSLTDDKSDN